MKKGKPIKAYYIGTEFPDYFGKEIEVRDDYSTSDPAYEIRFVGESQWHDNMDDEDWQKEPVKLCKVQGPHDFPSVTD